MDDILALDDGLEDEKAFLAVRQVSETADLFYRNMVSPWIRRANNESIAETLRQLHPMRMQRYMLSDLNPWMLPVKQTAAHIKNGQRRKPVADDNPFRAWETLVSGMIVDGLDLYRDARDAACEMMFQAVYENPWMKLLADFAGAAAPKNDHHLEALRRNDAESWRKHMATGEFSDAMVRMFLAIGFADQVLRRKGYAAISRLFSITRACAIWNRRTCARSFGSSPESFKPTRVRPSTPCPYCWTGQPRTGIHWPCSTRPSPPSVGN